MKSWLFNVVILSLKDPQFFNGEAPVLRWSWRLPIRMLITPVPSYSAPALHCTLVYQAAQYTLKLVFVQHTAAAEMSVERQPRG